MLLLVAIHAGLPAQQIVEGEYFFDTQRAYGAGTPISVMGIPNGQEADLNIDVSTLAEGFHRLFVRFRDDDWLWSQTYNYPIFIQRDTLQAIVSGEYFFDTVGEFGSGERFEISTFNFVIELSQSLSTDDLADGLHRLFVRFQTSDGRWTQTQNYSVLVEHAQVRIIVRGEYFFDVTLGYGLGFPIAVDSLGSITTVTDLISVPEDVPPGERRLFYRFQDNQGLWSQTFSELVCANVVEGHYEMDASTYCPGDTVFFNYSAAVSDEISYSWDLDNDGSFVDLVTNGNDFFTIPMASEEAVFRYQLTAPELCPNWQAEDSLLATISQPLVQLDSITDNSGGGSDGAIAITASGGTLPYTYDWQFGGTTISTEEDPSGLPAGVYIVVVTDAVGCSTSLENLTIEQTTSLVAYEGGPSIQVFPNPATSQLQIADAAQALYEVFLPDGRLVLSGFISNDRYTIDIEALPIGILFVRIQTQLGSGTWTVHKQ